MKAVIKILFPKSIASNPIAGMTKNAVGEGGYLLVKACILAIALGIAPKHEIDIFSFKMFGNIRKKWSTYI
ncbi:hypothetical protein AB4Y30_08340 [Ornithinibacillus sp. 4-3]|uniref:Uncharacterized protein n=1 Tax=Ornithinibacillus sp. 4-3 TaxID=3231488 RepID=A0AB39HVW2_9BACI